MTSNFMTFLTVFQANQDDGKDIERLCATIEPCIQLKRFLPPAVNRSSGSVVDNTLDY